MAVVLKGFDQLKKRLKEAEGKIRKEGGRELQDLVDRVSRNAVRDAPVDVGRLRSGIRPVKKDELKYEVISEANYSAYLEFGTKKRVHVPSGLEEIASAAKGKGSGSAASLRDMILQWVKNKGIRFDSAAVYKSGKNKGKNRKLTLEETAYIIYHFIAIRGIKPQPFFFKNFTEAEQKKTIDNIKKILGDL